MSGAPQPTHHTGNSHDRTACHTRLVHAAGANIKGGGCPSTSSG
jgi:hypothetical protein